MIQKKLIPFIFFLCGNAYGLEGAEPLRKILLEKSPALNAAHLHYQGKRHGAQAAYSTYYPSLSAITGWEENQVTDPLDKKTGAFGYLEGRLNIFNGFQDQAKIKEYTLESEISQTEQEILTRTLQVDLTEAATEMIYLHEMQEIIIKEIKVTKEQKQMAAKKVSSGLTSDVDNLELDLREAEIQIQQRQIDQMHLETHQKLIQLLGADVTDKELHSLSFSKPKTIITPDFLDGQKNLETQKANLLFEQSFAKETATRGQQWPSIDFNYKYGQLTPASGEFNFKESFYGVQLTLPLFAGFGMTHRQKASEISAQAQKAEYEQIRLNALSTYSSLVGKIKELKDLYDINEKKMLTAEKYYQLTGIDYRRGVKNSPDLIGATERWFSAQKRKPEILKEIEITQAKLEKIAGKIQN